MAAADDVNLQWFVGLDPAGTEVGNALWNGQKPAPALVGLFSLTFDTSDGVLSQIGTNPVFLLLGLDGSNVIRFKPQNLVTGLPLTDDGRTDTMPAAMGRA